MIIKSLVGCVRVEPAPAATQARGHYGGALLNLALLCLGRSRFVAGIRVFTRNLLME